MNTKGRLVPLALLLPLGHPTLGGDYEAAARVAEEEWSAWAADAYESRAVAEARVLAYGSKRSSTSKLARSAELTVRCFDSLFPPEPRPADAPPRRTAVLVELANEEDLASVTAFLATRHPELAGWSRSAAKGVGFALGDPPCAGWLLDVPQNEVWSPENELVNRLARLLLLERFGLEPNWLELGLAWHVEICVCKDVYCFPYRSGFVSKKEHKRWDARLAEVMKARAGAPVALGELTGWARGNWDEVRAVLSYGAAVMLARHYGVELPAVLSAFAAERREKGREVHADGSWVTIPDYEIPEERQRALLDAILGVDFAAELTRFAAAPKGYRRPR